MGFEETLVGGYEYLVFWFKTFCLYFRDVIKNCNQTQQHGEIYLLQSHTICFGDQTTINKSLKTVTATSVTYHYIGKTTSLQSPHPTTLAGSICTDNMTETGSASHVAVQSDTIALQSHIAVYSVIYCCTVRLILL